MQPSSSTVVLPVQKINASVISNTIDILATEEPLEIRLEHGNEKRVQQNISVTMRTPGNDDELAAGFLFTEGIIHCRADIDSFKKNDTDENVISISICSGIEIKTEKLERHFYTTSSCGVCGKTSIEAIKTVCSFPNQKNDRRYPASLIHQLPAKLRSYQSIFEQTGGLHAAALFNSAGEILLVKEDVGRHNALDKLIGAAMLNEMLPLNDQILLLSGRISFELVQKAAMAGITIIAAVGAPSSLAVETARSFGICLVGFLRDERFNIYLGEQKIVTSG
jgi:FdhD protein